MADFRISDLKDPNHLTGTAGAILGIRAGQTLFRSGGRLLLSPSAQRLVRDAVSLGPGPKLVAHAAELLPGTTGQGLLDGLRASSAAREGARAALQSAPRVLARTLGAAALLGGIIDGVIGAVHARRLLRNRELTRDEALRHVAAESLSGAAAGSAAALACAAVVSVTAASTLPVLGLGVATAVATKAAGNRIARRAGWLAPSAPEHHPIDVVNQASTPRIVP